MRKREKEKTEKHQKRNRKTEKKRNIYKSKQRTHINNRK